MLNRLRRLAPRALRRGRAAERDVDELLSLARLSFVRVQDAWDRADLCALSDLATAPLLEDLRHQLALRGPGQIGRASCRERV